MKASVSVSPEKERNESSTGVFEEKHGSEWRGRDHHVPTDQGSVPPCQPHGAWKANRMEEVADASTSKFCFQTSHAELGGLLCISGLVPSHQQLRCVYYRICVMHNIEQ